MESVSLPQFHMISKNEMKLRTYKKGQKKALDIIDCIPLRYTCKWIQIFIHFNGNKSQRMHVKL